MGSLIILVFLVALIAWILWPVVVGKRCPKCKTQLVDAGSRRSHGPAYDHWQTPYPDLRSSQSVTRLWRCPNCGYNTKEDEETLDVSDYGE